MTERTEDAQTNALRAFLLLCALEDDWRGKLVLVRGLGAEGRAVSVAASIAGGACLAIEPDAEACRATLRAGACDFIVNSVDEALRILKNEIRKQKPVSVALQTAELPALEELVARGVAPDVVAVTGAATPGLTTAFQCRVVAEADAASLVEDYVRDRQLAFHEFCSASPQELREFGGRLAAATAQAGMRSRWAAFAPGFFYRDRPCRRVAFLTATELAEVVSRH